MNTAAKIPTQITIEDRLQMLKAAAQADPYPALKDRLSNLRKLKQQIQRYQDAITAAAAKDFGWRAPAESKLIDALGPVLEINHALHSLKKWMKPSRRSTELLFLSNSATVFYQPKGVVGIITPWNFPLYLSLGPLIASLAAGNRAMIKMPDNCPNTTALLQTILGEIFPTNLVEVIPGDHPDAMKISELPFDHLIFTGSPASGKTIMKNAANNLVPVTLELGGKSPAIVGADADLNDAAKRIAHGKALNGGQVCLAPDYALVPRQMMNEFIEALRKEFTQMHSSVGGSEDYTALIDERAERRFLSMLEEAKNSGADIIRCGGNGRDRQHPLHIIKDPNTNLRIMQEEIFGPALPVLPYDNIEDAITFVNSRERPLALYLFSHDKAMRDNVLQKTHSGGVSINDWGWHAFNHDMPFGGIGNSGMGSYHGEEGFRELSNARSTFKRHRYFPIGLFYPPYGTVIQKMAMKLFLGNPDSTLGESPKHSQYGE